MYTVTIPSGKRSANYYTVPLRYSIREGWALNPTDNPVTVAREGKPTKTVPPKSFAKFDAAEIKEPLRAATLEDMNDVIGPQIKAVIEKDLPKCIFWKYSDQYLLPGTIDITTFVANPETCVPLRSMFELAGYAGDEIGLSISKARSHSPHRYIKLLRKVQEAATAHIREVWKDHKLVHIELQPNGEKVHPIVSDESVPLDMASRSDGFKRFVSFLLQVSAKVRSNQLKGALLLVDEPEIGLHPGGARNLTQELIKVGGTNTVVYSTHSIFMVDQQVIDRHLIVEKKNEVTVTSRAEKSRIQDEQVLYAAMGYSVFETLKARNVIFEGWKDKELFRITAEAMSKGDKEAKDSLALIGLTFAEGVKDVKTVASFLELASRKCVIISDADAPAMEKKKQYLKIGAWGKWFTLRDILGAASTVATGEDLILKTAIVKRANKWRGQIPSLSALTAASLEGKPHLTSLAQWLASAKLAQPELDKAVSELKNALFQGLKRDEISDEAEELVKFVLNHDFK